MSQDDCNLLRHAPAKPRPGSVQAESFGRVRGFAPTRQPIHCLGETTSFNVNNGHHDHLQSVHLDNNTPQLWTARQKGSRNPSTLPTAQHKTICRCVTCKMPQPCPDALSLRRLPTHCVLLEDCVQRTLARVARWRRGAASGSVECNTPTERTRISESVRGIECGVCVDRFLFSTTATLPARSICCTFCVHELLV